MKAMKATLTAGERITLILGTAILRNDKNYTPEIMAVFRDFATAMQAAVPEKKILKPRQTGTNVQQVLAVEYNLAIDATTAAQAAVVREWLGK